MIRDAILVGLFSWVGVLVRIGFYEFYSHSFIHGNIPGPITKNFYPNVAGCLILGFLVSLQTKIKEKYPPLYVGLASGLCGSLTTFSGLAEDANNQIIAHNVTSFFAVLFVGFGCPYWILLLGVNTAAYFFPFVPLPSSAPIAMASNRSTESGSELSNINETDYSVNSNVVGQEDNVSNREHISPHPHVSINSPNVPKTSPPTPPTPPTASGTPPTPVMERNEDDITGVATAPEGALEPKQPHVHYKFYTIAVVIGILLFLMLALLASLRNPPSYVTFSCIFAPFGALTRWYLATYNLKFPKFPIFTFFVNFVGSLLVAGFTILLDRSDSSTAMAALNGAITGFCGALTTTSTFLNEARLLELKHAFFYVVISIFLTQSFMLAINGPYFWTR